MDEGVQNPFVRPNRDFGDRARHDIVVGQHGEQAPGPWMGKRAIGMRLYPDTGIFEHPGRA